MVGIEIIIGYFITGIIWGSTNAFMERGSKSDKEQDPAKEDSNELKEGVKMFTNVTFLVPFLVN